MCIEPVLLTTARVETFNGGQSLTRASGLFLRRGKRLFLVTSRHVVVDEPSGHHPNRLELELHDDRDNLASTTRVSVDLFEGSTPLWRVATDTGGEVDVAAIPIPNGAVGQGLHYRAFTKHDLLRPEETVEIGTPVLTIGYPLGFRDRLHHLPVARRAGVASSFGLRFSGQGFFLVDAWTHRGISGAPVVIRDQQVNPSADHLGWKLLGVHSARLEAAARDPQHDEVLGLNAVWYADVLLTLTDD